MTPDDPEGDLVDVGAGRLWRRAARGGDPAHVTLEADLGLRWPIRAVDPGGAADRILDVALSDDGQTWSRPAPAEGATAEGATADGAGSGLFVLAPGEGAWGRHLRVVLAGPRGPEAAGPRAWCERAQVDLIALRRLLDVAFDLVDERPGANPYVAYSLVCAERPRSRTLVGLAIYENGAFGNCLIQCLLAIGIARNLDLKYIKLPRVDRSEVIALSRPVTLGGITFIPGSDPLPPDGLFLSGMYFDLGIQKLAGALGADETREIVRTCIRPLFNRLPDHVPDKRDDELLIHIRSGDIFGTWVAPTYPQPPLAFYRLVIGRLLAEGRIASIKLVFENRLNPVIPELEAHIARLGVPMTTQSGTLTDDVAALMNGRYLVFGLGTFGPGVCQLSDRVEAVYYFASNWPQHFKSIATIGKVVEVRDVAGAYTKVGEWDNSPERRALMLDYPIENLAFDDAPG